MSIELNKNDPRIAHLIRGYKGRLPVRVSTAKTHCVSNMWDGGSKDETFMVELQTGRFISLAEAGFVKQEQGNPFGQAIGTVELKPGVAALVRVTFMGKDRGFRLYLHESDFEQFK